MMEAETNNGRGEGALSGPLLLLPEEIWENILNNLTDSRDIQNVFKAFPVLEGLVLKNHYCWLLDQVMPHLFPYLKKKEVLRCRLVCKRWTQGVDNCLENLPPCRPFEHGVVRTGQLWIPGASQTDHALTRYRRLEFQLTGWAWIKDKNLSDFLQGRNAHPRGRNPVVGRSAVFMDSGIDGGLPDGDDGGRFEYGETILKRSTDFWNMALECAGTLGEHIWFLTLSFEFLVILGSIKSVVQDFLSALPNLKLLRIECVGNDYQTESRFDPQWLEKHLACLPQSPNFQLRPWPKVPQLETVELYCDSEFRNSQPQETVNFLISGYKSQIRKLDLQFGFCLNRVCELFPNLIELRLPNCYDNKGHAIKILKSLAPELQSLYLYISGPMGSADMADDIISCLGRFQRLTSLTLNLEYGLGRRMEGKGGLETPKPPRCDPPTIQSLKSFEVTGWMEAKLSLSALKGFPSLEYLKVSMSEANVNLDGMEVKHPNLWEMLPKLRKAILPPYERVGREGFIFTRAKYEWAKQKWGLVEPLPSRTVLNALRAACFPWNERGQPQHFEEADLREPDEEDEDTHGDEEDMELW